MSIEAEKDSNYRYSPISGQDVFNFIAELDDPPDVICKGGWWPRDDHEAMLGSPGKAGYRGISSDEAILDEKQFLGKRVHYFSSSHERSHILCAFGMSPLPKGTPCYALVWEGAIGAFYEIDSDLNVILVADVLNQPGNRYAQLYGLADPTFDKRNHPRFSDAGKLMALASFSTRTEPTKDERELMRLLIEKPFRDLNSYSGIGRMVHYNVGVEDHEFRNFAGIYSQAIFETFHQYAVENLEPDRPLLIAGGCGLNCDWNTNWRQSGFFSEIFVPPVANDSGSAIGTAIDAQFHFTGNPKIEWDVYSGLEFNTHSRLAPDRYDVREVSYEQVADLLADDLILGWVNGRYEIGPRALGNRSILANPFHDQTRDRLNEIKGREHFRPIAPVCLLDEASRLFGCNDPSPYMLYTYNTSTDALPAVTHVNGTARIQTVTRTSNEKLFRLLTAFKARTGYGVLCNTSLNFNGKGFINNIHDLDAYTVEYGLDGFVVNGTAFLVKNSERYMAHAKRIAVNDADRHDRRFR